MGIGSRGADLEPSTGTPVMQCAGPQPDLGGRTFAAGAHAGGQVALEHAVVC